MSHNSQNEAVGPAVEEKKKETVQIKKKKVMPPVDVLKKALLAYFQDCEKGTFLTQLRPKLVRNARFNEGAQSYWAWLLNSRLRMRLMFYAYYWQDTPIPKMSEEDKRVLADEDHWDPPRLPFARRILSSLLEQLGGISMDDVKALNFQDANFADGFLLAARHHRHALKQLSDMPKGHESTGFINLHLDDLALLAVAEEVGNQYNNAFDGFTPSGTHVAVEAWVQKTLACCNGNTVGRCGRTFFGRVLDQAKIQRELDEIQEMDDKKKKDEKLVAFYRKHPCFKV